MPQNGETLIPHLLWGSICRYKNLEIVLRLPRSLQGSEHQEMPLTIVEESGLSLGCLRSHWICDIWKSHTSKKKKRLMLLPCLPISNLRSLKTSLKQNWSGNHQIDRAVIAEKVLAQGCWPLSEFFFRFLIDLSLEIGVAQMYPRQSNPPDSLLSGNLELSRLRICCVPRLWQILNQSCPNTLLQTIRTQYSIFLACSFGLSDLWCLLFLPPSLCSRFFHQFLNLCFSIQETWKEILCHQFSRSKYLELRNSIQFQPLELQI